MNKEIFVKLLAQRQFKAVRSILDVMNEVDIASLLSDLDDKELALAFRLIPKDKAAEVFANMNHSMQTYLVEMFSEKELKELLDDLYMDDTVDLLEELPANLVNRILNTVDQADRTLINQLLNYPDDSAGTLMTTEYVDIRETMTVAQAMAHIKETGIHKETIYTCYVTDQRRLLGIVSAKDLMTTADDVLIRDLMQTEIISVSTHTDKEEVAQLFTKYDFLALPVLDQDKRLVGIVTFDDAMDVMVDEATEDITKMAAMSPSEKSYFETSVFAHAKHRIAWLLILMFSAVENRLDISFPRELKQVYQAIQNQEEYFTSTEHFLPLDEIYVEQGILVFFKKKRTPIAGYDIEKGCLAEYYKKEWHKEWGGICCYQFCVGRMLTIAIENKPVFKKGRCKGKFVTTLNIERELGNFCNENYHLLSEYHVYGIAVMDSQQWILCGHSCRG